MKYIPTRQLEEKAEETLAATRAGGLPVDLELIAVRLGLRVERADFTGGETEIEPEVSGLLVIKGDSGTIGLNAKHPDVRQRFTLAHEIGHFVLHRSSSDLFIDKGFRFFRDKRSSKATHRAEIQANQFAAALLMPRSEVEREIATKQLDLADGLALQQLADRFGVSSQAMSLRLANLDLLGEGADL